MIVLQEISATDIEFKRKRKKFLCWLGAGLTGSSVPFFLWFFASSSRPSLI